MGFLVGGFPHAGELLLGRHSARARVLPGAERRNEWQWDRVWCSLGVCCCSRSVAAASLLGVVLVLCCAAGGQQGCRDGGQLQQLPWVLQGRRCFRQPPRLDATGSAPAEH